ncbi:MAG: ROK family protein [Candidatus Eremiobacteraeota bacterium]|nr:ROK family protein [Candidatus Eremiobacteraeota bacterium]
MPDADPAAPDSGTARDRYVVGVDLGGTKISVGVVSVDGSRVFAVRTSLTRAELGPAAVVDRMVEMIEVAIALATVEAGVERSAILGVGLGAPGVLDRDGGTVLIAPNLGWHDMPVRALIAERVGLPATLDNDANCATLGEWWTGAARGAQHVVGLTIGTGIGGGIILNGRLVHGASNAAGEVGHTTIETAGRKCACGNYGCLEAYASGPNIALRAREALEVGEPSILPELVGGDLAQITAATVYEASDRGDALAREVVRDTARFLGAGVANLVNILNPDVVVLAGGVVQAGAALFEPLRAEVRRRAFRPAVEAARIVPGALDGTAGIVGAARTFLDAYEVDGRDTGAR